MSIRTAPQSTARLARQTWLIITAEIKERTVNGYMSALRRFIVETHEEFDVPAVTPQTAAAAAAAWLSDAARVCTLVPG